MLSRLPVRPKMLGVVVALLAAPVLAGEAEFCVSGTLVNALTGEPIRRAAVTIPQSAVLTDAAGTFRFCGLSAGSYYTNGEKPGFAASGLAVTVGPSRDDVLLRLQPLAAIKGKVLDASGEPLENALIQLLSLAVEDGWRKARVESAVSTDDRGEYRLAGLAPGRYLVRAAGWQGAVSRVKQPDSSETFTPVYYGGATDLVSATPLTAEPGREVSADFLVALEISYRIHGALAGFSAHIPAEIELLGAEGDPSAAPIAFDAATGAFQINNVAPGSYVLRATEGEGGQRRRGEQAVQVGSADVYGVVVTLAAAVVLKGTVQTAGASGAVPQPPGCQVDLSPATVSMSGEAKLESSTGDDGEFEFAGVLPGRYRVRMDCANGYIAAAHAGETDLLAHEELLIPPGVAPPPLQAVLNTDGGTVDVTAAQESGDAVQAWLALLPDAGSDLHARFALIKGQRTLTGVAPGDYQVYCWTGSPADFEYANPAARQVWAGRAVSLHVTEHDHQSITVKVSPGESP